jgi:hypothetical protein
MSVIKNITTYGRKNKQIKRNNVAFNDKRKYKRGSPCFPKQFKLGHLLRPFAQLKRQGFSLILILLAMILSRLGGLSLYAMQKTGRTKMDDMLKNIRKIRNGLLM